MVWYRLCQKLRGKRLPSCLMQDRLRLQPRRRDPSLETFAVTYSCEFLLPNVIWMKCVSGAKFVISSEADCLTATSRWWFASRRVDRWNRVDVFGCLV